MTNTEYSGDDAGSLVTPLEQAVAEEPLARELPDWNASSPGIVFTASSREQGEIVRGLLESEGIPAVYEPLPGDSQLSPSILGDTHFGYVVVPEEYGRQARELIAAYERRGLDDREIVSSSVDDAGAV